jgi:hypothetical protein
MVKKNGRIKKTRKRVRETKRKRENKTASKSKSDMKQTGGDMKLVKVRSNIKKIKKTRKNRRKQGKISGGAAATQAQSSTPYQVYEALKNVLDQANNTTITLPTTGLDLVSLQQMNAWDCCKDSKANPIADARTMNELLNELFGPLPTTQHWTVNWSANLHSIFDRIMLQIDRSNIQEIVFERDGIKFGKLVQTYYVNECGMGGKRVATNSSEVIEFDTAAQHVDEGPGSGNHNFMFPPVKKAVSYSLDIFNDLGFPKFIQSWESEGVANNKDGKDTNYEYRVEIQEDEKSTELTTINDSNTLSVSNIDKNTFINIGTNNHEKKQKIMFKELGDTMQSVLYYHLYGLMKGIKSDIDQHMTMMTCDATVYYRNLALRIPSCLTASTKLNPCDEHSTKTGQMYIPETNPNKILQMFLRAECEMTRLNNLGIQKLLAKAIFDKSLFIFQQGRRGLKPVNIISGNKNNIDYVISLIQQLNQQINDKKDELRGKIEHDLQTSQMNNDTTGQAAEVPSSISKEVIKEEIKKFYLPPLITRIKSATPGTNVTYVALNMASFTGTFLCPEGCKYENIYNSLNSLIPTTGGAAMAMDVQSQSSVALQNVVVPPLSDVRQHITNIINISAVENLEPERCSELLTVNEEKLIKDICMKLPIVYFEPDVNANNYLNNALDYVLNLVYVYYCYAIYQLHLTRDIWMIPPSSPTGPLLGNVNPPYYDNDLNENLNSLSNKRLECAVNMTIAHATDQDVPRVGKSTQVNRALAAVIFRMKDDPQHYPNEAFDRLRNQLYDVTAHYAPIRRDAPYHEYEMTLIEEPPLTPPKEENAEAPTPEQEKLNNILTWAQEAKQSIYQKKLKIDVTIQEAIRIANNKQLLIRRNIKNWINEKSHRYKNKRTQTLLKNRVYYMIRNQPMVFEQNQLPTIYAQAEEAWVQAVRQGRAEGRNVNQIIKEFERQHDTSRKNKKKSRVTTGKETRKQTVSKNLTTQTIYQKSFGNKNRVKNNSMEIKGQ